jgi:hypothetical protein
VLFCSTWLRGDGGADDDGDCGSPPLATELSRAGWVSLSDASARFVVNTPVYGDVLVRCQHLHDNGRRETMFRAAFHTGYDSCVSRV